MRRVVFTGVGLVTPLGNNAKSTWASVLDGKSGVAPITLFNAEQLPTKFAAEVKNFDPLVAIPPKEIKKMDRFIQLGIVAAMEAIKSAGENLCEDPERLGVVLCAGMGGLPNIELTTLDTHEKGPKRAISPFFIPSVIANLLSGYISIFAKAQGPNFCITSACSSSAHGIGEAFRMIQRGECDVMIAGGAESTISMLGVGGFNAMKALSTRNDDMTTASRPFDTDRDGFVIGEGAGVVVIEELEHAKRRGVPILGEIVGYAARSDAYHITLPPDDGAGAERCMKAALKDAGLKPSDIGYINAHGTSTPSGDAAESSAVLRIFGDDARKNAGRLVTSSTKSMTGHLLGAAGAVEAAFCLQALKEQICPPTMNVFNQDPKCDLFVAPNQPIERRFTYAMTNSFGFGGTNACIILKSWNGT